MNLLHVVGLESYRTTMAPMTACPSKLFSESACDVELSTEAEQFGDKHIYKLKALWVRAQIEVRKTGGPYLVRGY